MRFGLFGGARADKAVAAREAARIKDLVREVLNLTENTAVAVNEIICADPACPGSETVILVMKVGEKTKAFKLQMAMADVTPEALRAELAGEP